MLMTDGLVYGLETLIVNIYAPIMNDLDFSHMFEVLTSQRLKDLWPWVYSVLAVIH